MSIDKLLRFAVEHGASDIHVQAGAPPMLRIGGQARFLESTPLTGQQTAEYASAILPKRFTGRLEEAMVGGIDFSHFIEGLSRFRVSVYSQSGTAAMVIRVIKVAIPSLDSLSLPAVVKDIAVSQRGLTLVTGTTGSGKSTTLAAMIDLINSTVRSKILTIEDPIEYYHPNKKSLISQLELGADTPSFDQALRQALRQDPDVILVGELRDVDTLRIALRAADTGHQVFSTIHSATAPQTIERIVAMFPPGEHALLLAQLAHSVEAILSQRLLPTKDGKRRPAVEILRGQRRHREVYPGKPVERVDGLHCDGRIGHAELRPALAQVVPRERDLRHGGTSQRHESRCGSRRHARHYWPCAVSNAVIERITEVRR